LRDRAAAGRQVVLLVGNHDRALLTDRGKAHPAVAGLAAAVRHDFVHHAADGQRYLVLHGDVCDARLLRFHVWTRLGSRTDSFLRLLDRGLRRMRLRFGPEARGPMELAICALNGLMYRGRRHERRLVQLARAAGCHGVICGHFHIAALHDDHGLRYANCGDWTDSCTALIEDHGGTLALVAHGAAPAPARALATAQGTRP
jgi:UDP-2,3-diacylglucosamine pyrophosphatase LpxH